jgi:hypothetical protein
MSKELACGKAAKRTKGFGAQSMTTKDMEKFIKEHGTDGAKNALKSVKGVPSRGDLCVIFHSFRAGRAEIAKGEGVRNFRLTPSPNRRRVAAARSMSSLSSPNLSPKKLLDVVAFMKGKEKRNLKRVLQAFPRKNRLGYLKLKRESTYGPRMLTGRPGHARNFSNHSNGNRNNGRNYSNDNYFGKGNVHFVRGGLNNKRNTVPENKKKEKVSRFNMTAAFLGQKVKAGERLKRMPAFSSSSGSPKRRSPRPLKMQVFPRTGKLERKLTRSVPFHRAGSRAGMVSIHLRNADRARWNKFNKVVRASMTNAERSKLANKILQDSIRKAMGSNSNSNAASPTARRKMNVKARLMKKLKKRRVVPKTNLAKMFSRTSVKANRAVSNDEFGVRRASKKEIEELRKHYAKTAGVKSNSN